MMAVKAVARGHPKIRLWTSHSSRSVDHLIWNHKYLQFSGKNSVPGHQAMECCIVAQHDLKQAVGHEGVSVRFWNLRHMWSHLLVP